MFWHFLNLDPRNNGDEDALNLAQVVLLSYQPEDAMQNLLRTQVASAEAFFEKLRGAGGVEFARERLPSFLLSASLEETLWPLVKFFATGCGFSCSAHGS